MKPTAITLLSGGLDSAVATQLAARESEIALALTFDYGQRAAEREIAIAQRLCADREIEHRVVALPWLGGETATALVDRTHALPERTPDGVDANAQDSAAAVWVPARNAIFIAIAAAYAEARGAKRIIAGFNIEEAQTFPDNSQGFVDAANALLAFATRTNVRVDSPTVGMSKPEIARAFLDLKIAPSDFWCCYEGAETLCGRCESCARTKRAFQTIGAWETIAARFDT